MTHPRLRLFSGTVRLLLAITLLSAIAYAALKLLNPPSDGPISTIPLAALNADAAKWVQDTISADTDDDTLFTLAARYIDSQSAPDFARLRALLAFYPRVALLTDSNQQTLLHIACRKHNLPAALELLNAGADPTAKDDSDYTPLTIVLVNNSSRALVDLIQLRTPVHDQRAATLSDDDLLLFARAMRGRDTTSITRYLDKWPILANTVIPDLKATPLIYAAGRHHVELVRILLDHGANIEATNELQQTPLHRAAETGAYPNAILLLERGANVDARTANGETPLHFAVEGPWPQMVRILLDAGANPNLHAKSPHDGKFRTPRDIAVQKRCQLCISNIDYALAHKRNANVAPSANHNSTKVSQAAPSPKTLPTNSVPGQPVTGDPVTTASGLIYYDIVLGNGQMPSSTAANVKLHYTGWFLDGTKFDSSVDRGQPATFQLNRLISGWTEGVSSMGVGGKRKLVIPPELAYGKKGSNIIPPNATLVFDIELLQVDNSTKVSQAAPSPKTLPANSLPGEPVTGDPVTTATGLMYYDIVLGNGQMPSSTAANVKVHYTGWLLDGTKFDSSVDRGQLATFPLNRVISGWTEGVSSMRVGGKRKLVIPAELAYGSKGSNIIPPDATLVFDIELFSVD